MPSGASAMLLYSNNYDKVVVAEGVIIVPVMSARPS